MFSPTPATRPYRAALAAPFAALLLAAAPVPAAPSAADRAMLDELRRGDVRLATIAYRLATQAGSLCPRTRPQSGLLLHNAAQYAPALRPAARAAFGFGDGAGVEAVVAGSAAERAGLRANDRLLGINGAPIAVPLDPRKSSYAPQAALLTQLEAALDAGPATLTVARDGGERAVAVTGVPGCISRVQLIPGGKYNASADGDTASVSTLIMTEAADDDELAFMIGHEMSHNILGHRARLDGAGVGRGLFAGFGRNARTIRDTEVEADYLGLYLMARAGFDADAAAIFWRRFDRAHGHGIFADATHLNGAVRIRFLQLTAQEIAGQRAAGRAPTPDFAGLPQLTAAARAAPR